MHVSLSGEKCQLDSRIHKHAQGDAVFSGLIYWWISKKTHIKNDLAIVFFPNSHWRVAHVLFCAFLEFSHWRPLPSAVEKYLFQLRRQTICACLWKKQIFWASNFQNSTTGYGAPSWYGEFKTWRWAKRLLVVNALSVFHRSLPWFRLNRWLGFLVVGWPLSGICAAWKTEFIENNVAPTTFVYEK